MTEVKKHFGRPREHDREQIAKDLIEWAQEDDSINLNKFCALNGFPPSYLTKWSNESTDFRESYEYAKTFLGFRREEMLSSELLHVKAYDLNAKTYDYFLEENTIQHAKRNASLNAEAESKKQNITINLTDYSKVNA